jgi:hypothetical protein
MNALINQQENYNARRRQEIAEARARRKAKKRKTTGLILGAAAIAAPFVAPAVLGAVGASMVGAAGPAALAGTGASTVATALATTGVGALNASAAIGGLSVGTKLAIGATLANFASSAIDSSPGGAGATVQATTNAALSIMGTVNKMKEENRLGAGAVGLDATAANADTTVVPKGGASVTQEAPAPVQATQFATSVPAQTLSTAVPTVSLGTTRVPAYVPSTANRLQPTGYASQTLQNLFSVPPTTTLGGSQYTNFTEI